MIVGLIAKIADWWRRIRPPSKTERYLFRYWDGRRFRWADPLVVFQRLTHDPEFCYGNGPDDPRSEIGPALEFQEPHFSRLVAAVHRAFGTHPFDGRYGLTHAEALHLFSGFVYWVDALIKKNSRSSTSSPPTDSQCSTCQESPDGTTSSPSP